MQTDPQRSTIDSLNVNVKLPQIDHWKVCPSCTEEMSSLRACQYLNDDNRSVVTSLCVVCAETLVAFDKIAARSPLDGVHVEVKWSGPKRTAVTIGERLESIGRPANAYAVVSYGTTRYMATSNGTGTPIQFKQEGQTEPQYANNVFMLWSMIKRQLLNPKTEETEHRMDQVRTARREHQYA